MSIAQEPKQRKPHQAKFQTLAARREADKWGFTPPGGDPG